MAPREPIDVAIVGVGLVGEQVVLQLTATHLRPFFRIKSLFTSKKHVQVHHGHDQITGEDLVQLLKGTPPSSDRSSASVRDYSGGVEELVSFLCDRSCSARPMLVVDCTSSQELAESYPRLLRAGHHELHLVTPNKKAFSGSQDLFDQIEKLSAENQNLVFKEATVGAGLPVLSTLRELVLTGDEIHKIEGVLSGTMSYIFNQFSCVSHDSVTNPKMTLSQVVKLAQSKGYTEPNPADDLDGSDVARKLSILFRQLPKSLGRQAPSVQLPDGFKSVFSPLLFPSSCFEKRSPEEFLSSLTAYDDLFEKQKFEALQAGCLLRYVGTIDLATHGVEHRVKAGLAKYPVNHPFSTLAGSDNILAFYTKRYPVNPLIIRGAGAGAEVTAMGVVGDMIKVVERLIGNNISV